MAGTGDIYGSAHNGRPAARLLLRRAAGVSWTNRTLKAPWAGRDGHSTVIDAAGAIYVIGGYNVGTTRYQDDYIYFNDVLVSTDGGAQPDSVGGGPGILRGTKGLLSGTRGTREVPRVLAVYRWYSMVYTRDAEGYLRGTRDTLENTLGDPVEYSVILLVLRRQSRGAQELHRGILRG